MIQMLTYTGKENKLKGKDVVLNSLHDAHSLDEFEINIIDLSDENVWANNGKYNSSVNDIKDFKSISFMLKNSDRAQNIIFFPQNVTFYYDKPVYENKFLRSCELKDMIYHLTGSILPEILHAIDSLEIIYENTSTIVGQKKFPAAFFFNNPEVEVLTKSDKSEKPTTIKMDDTIISTLKIKSYEELMLFLKELKLLNDKQELPEWVQEVKMFDDEKQMKIIEENNQTIENANCNISKALEVINKNNRYKSILYTNGDELVEVVFEILQEMLGCDLSEFTDKKKEDFNFTINEKTFVGEIKGVTPNAKKTNVSQLDVHVQEYLETHDVKEENIVALLIINHQRNKPLSEREPVHNEVINHAKRNGSLIVETITLLKMFEKYLAGELMDEECINAFVSNIGLLTI